MKRLTERIDGWVIKKGCHGPCRTCTGAECIDLYPIIERLADYEDTGLEPGEVTAIKHDLMGQGIAKITEFDGIPIKRMIELAQAEKDRRLVVLPPNDPLTLEQLREMDGEPVWIEWGGHPQAGWALVRVWSKANNVIYLTYHNGNTDLLGYVLADGGKIFRRKPEEKNNESDSSC